MTHRASAWLERWRPILPLLLAEGTISLGFGAILPILPIYFRQHGVDLPTLGLVVAAWPAARLVGEPAFGWLADRTSRKWMMVWALVLSAFAIVLPLFAVGPLAFILTRALSGLFAAMYDPAARGYLVDANLPERQGETFGMYGSAQMGGFMIGPAVGGLAAALTGEPTVVFWVCGVAFALSAVLVAFRVTDRPRLAPGATEVAGANSPADGVQAADAQTTGAQPSTAQPRTLLNRLLIVAVVLNVGSYLAGGTYEVIWSLYMTSLGASIGLIGLSFFTFSLPVMLLSPFGGRFIDREGGYGALVVGMVGVSVCGLLYTLIANLWWVIGLGLVEGAAFAFASPALYTLVSRASPAGRSSTAQGIFGAAGTIGTITASVTAGALAQVDIRLPFLVSGASSLVILAIGVALGGRRLWAVMQPEHLDAVAAEQTAPGGASIVVTSGDAPRRPGEREAGS